MTSPRLSDKVAIVTGGGTGIGEAICKKFIDEGASVLIAGLPGDPVHEVSQEIRANGGRSTDFSGDLSDDLQARACVKLALDTFGKVDILVNNAGSFPNLEELQSFPTDDFMLLFKNNILSAFMMTRAALPELQKSNGVILFAGSESGLVGLEQGAPYAGTKGFLHSFAKSLAAEQAKHGVRVNCVCPGPIDTSWTHRQSGPMDLKTEKMAIASTLMGRRGTPEEVANVYAFLASDEASYVTGSLYKVDGGITIAKGPAGLQAERDMKKPPAGRLDLSHSREGRPKGEREAPRQESRPQT